MNSRNLSYEIQIQSIHKIRFRSVCTQFVPTLLLEIWVKFKSSSGTSGGQSPQGRI